MTMRSGMMNEKFENESDIGISNASGDTEESPSISMVQPAKFPPSSKSCSVGDLAPAQSANISRSERKKLREQKRRKELNKGLDGLMALLIEIDPSIQTHAADRDKTRKGQSSKASTSSSSSEIENQLLNRVDLISRAVSVLERLNHENKQQKLMIQQLLMSKSAVFPSMQARPGFQRNDEIMMMMPYLAPAEGLQQYPQSGSSTGETEVMILAQHQEQMRMVTQPVAHDLHQQLQQQQLLQQQQQLQQQQFQPLQPLQQLQHQLGISQPGGFKSVLHQDTSQSMQFQYQHQNPSIMPYQSQVPMVTLQQPDESYQGIEVDSDGNPTKKGRNM